MWDDFKVGEGETGSTAHCIDTGKTKYNISENRVSYWVSNLILGLGGQIMKDTVEGREIEIFLKHKDFEGLDIRLTNIAVERTAPQMLITAIKFYGEEEFYNGRESIKREFRDLMT